MVRMGFTPNGVSVIGVVFALVGAAAYVKSSDFVGGARAGWLWAAAAMVQLRLLCNMLDGLIAVENNLKSKVGDLFNEVPDRIEDTALLLGAGYSLSSMTGATLAWTAALLAVGTAYVRALGGSFGFPQDFCGPFAKQQRMFFLTVATIAAGIEAIVTRERWCLEIGLAVICIGTLATLVRRLMRLARLMQAR